jgi:hypothetical protein
MKNKAVLFITKTVLFLLPVLIFFELLFRMGYAPIVTNSTFFDIKMRAIQKNHVKGVKILAFGSSIALFELKSDLIVQHFQAPYYNFGSWGLQMTDMNNLITGYVKEYHPQYVVICSSVGDFISPANDSYFNYINTPGWIKNNFPEYFYFKNYSSIRQIIRRKIKAYPLILDPWGGAALRLKTTDIADSVDGHMLFPTKYTGENYKQLDSMASFLHKNQIQLIFIQAPIRHALTDTGVSTPVSHAHFAACKRLVESQGGIYFNYDNPRIFSDSLFAGRYHLLDPGAILLTQEMIPDLQRIIH